jgi:amidase
MTQAHALGAVEAAGLIRDRRLNSETLVQSCLDRIAEQDPLIKAWVALDPDAALKQARARDGAQAPFGPLHGIPIGVKDVIDTCDFATAHGSPIYRDHRPMTDAACVGMLKRAGAVILGKTATAEFASISPPETRNPHDPTHTPGGSSSGSAAAVAAGMVPLALGTQTGGSIIRPAAFCGIVGFKPSYNLINRAGLKFSAESLDTIGMMARNVADVALLFNALLGAPIAGLQGTTAPAKIGVCRTGMWEAGDLDARQLLEDVVRYIQRDTVEVAEFDLPLPYSDLLGIHGRIIRYEAAHAMTPEYTTHARLFSDRFHARIEEGLLIIPQVHAGDLAAMDTARRCFDAAMSGFDALITLSTVGEAPLGLETTGESTFNSVWTLLGVPCVHVPLGRGRNGLPLGVQLIGARYGDQHLLGVAQWLEAAMTSIQSHPSAGSKNPVISRPALSHRPAAG